MVCSRCKMAVKAELEKAGLHPTKIELGEIEISDEPDPDDIHRLNKELKKMGFEIIDNRKSRLIEQIKNIIISFVHHSEENIEDNLSRVLSEKLHYEYNYLSNLFSEIEGTTIEKYFIAQRMERVKELLMYDELSLYEIADKLGYSSVSYLSNQFKKQTGLTPTFYKTVKDHKRKNIEEL